MSAQTILGSAALMAVLAAGACSSSTGRSATGPPVTATTVPPPTEWKTISYHGVGASIPANWEVVSGTSFVCSFGAAPVAYLGPTHRFYPCPMAAPGRAGNNGLWIDASYATPGASMIETWVHGVSVDIGLPADPTVARRIVESLRYDPAAPDSPS